MRGGGMNYPMVSIVVLNWNGGERVLRCLESLYQITYPNYYVIVVDNGSQDDSIQKIKEWAEGEIPVESKLFQYNPDGKPVRYVEYERKEAEAIEGGGKEIGDLLPNKGLIIIKNEENFGYAKGKNIGMKYALNVLNSEYILLQDNDTIVSPNFLDELISIANKEPGAGILGSKIYLYDEPDVVWSEGGLINYWTGNLVQSGARLHALVEGKDAVEMDYVSICCALVSRELCQTAGLLDEDFFWTCEDVEFCIRATKHGFKLLIVPKSEIWHDNARTRDYRRGNQVLQRYYVTKNRLILWQKHWGKLQLTTTALYWFTYYLRGLPHFLVFTRDWKVLKLRLLGLLDFFNKRNRSRRIEL